MHFEDSFECRGVAALRLDECDEFFPRSAVVEPCAELFSRNGGNLGRKIKRQVDEITRRLRLMASMRTAISPGVAVEGTTRLTLSGPTVSGKKPPNDST